MEGLWFWDDAEQEVAYVMLFADVLERPLPRLLMARPLPFWLLRAAVQLKEMM
jgi:hypothetical protein